MRTILMAAIVMGAITPAMACNDELFSVEDWRGTASDTGRHVRTDMDVDLRYDGDRPYRMIHAAAMFSDVIGNALVTVRVDRDRSVQPNEQLTISGAFAGEGSRITEIHRDDVVSRVCVWSIVYDDGTVEKFN